MKNSPYYSQLFLKSIKIQRIIPKLIAESFSIQKHCKNLGINRHWSHPCENRIGNIRYKCQGNHSIENILITTTRHEHMKRTLKNFSLKDHITFDDLIMKIGNYQNVNECFSLFSRSLQVFLVWWNVDWEILVLILSNFPINYINWTVINACYEIVSVFIVWRLVFKIVKINVPTIINCIKVNSMNILVIFW